MTDKKVYKLYYQTGIKNYIAENRRSFHMPGHKGRFSRTGIDDTILPDSLFPLDITASYEREDLYNPATYLKDSLAQLSDIYQTIKSFYLVNGSTGGNQAALFATLRPNDKILMPRNVHKLVYGALVATSAIPVYLDNDHYENNVLFSGIDPVNLEKFLNEQPDIKVVYLINPNYIGVCSDIKKSVGICKKYGKIVIVDEAHGAHFPFHPDLPSSALEPKADIVIQSAHKTLNALSQTALLHVCTERVDVARIESAISMYQTTSPNTVLLLSLEASVVQMANQGRKLLQNALSLSDMARAEINSMPRLHCYGDDLLQYGHIFSYDRTKLFVNVSRLGVSGYEVKNILGKKYKIEAELADHANILFSISILSTETDVREMINALKGIASSTRTSKSAYHPPTVPGLPSMASLTPAQAFYAAQVDIPLKKCAGKVSCEMIIPYPPGIPLIMPGEVITQEMVDYIDHLIKSDVKFGGNKYKDLSKIIVAK